MSIDAMQKALIALEFAYGGEPVAALEKEAIDALRQAIKQADHVPAVTKMMPVNIRPLYTAPPQREWVGLTDDDLDQLDCLALEYVVPGDCAIDCTSIRKYARAIETKLKEKNHVS